MVDQIAADDSAQPSSTPLLPPPPAPFPYLWFNGRLVPWSEATVHLSLVGWPSITAVFEGVRAYRNGARGSLAVFRLSEHLTRLDQSMRLQRMLTPFNHAQIRDAMVDLCRANDAAADVYLQPLAFVSGARGSSSWSHDSDPDLFITMRPAPSALPSATPLRAGVSTWTRISDDALPPRIKAIPNYANSRLASLEAARHGYDVAILLNRHGQVAESSSSCIFIVRNGRVITPPLTAGILESITRDTLITLCRDTLDLPIEEREIGRTELYTADEAFLCGTMVEVTPLASVDGFPLRGGEDGSITRRIAALYHDIVRGNDPRSAAWLTEVV